MSGHEQRFIADAFATNWLSSVGPNLSGFEEEVSRRLGSGIHALAVTSGTAALHLILRYVGVSKGDSVAVSTLTFAGSVYPILYLGGQPVFLDSERVSGNIDADVVRSYLKDSARKNALPKALIAVHLYGQHCDIDSIAEVCAEYGVTLIEDAAESLGATYRGRETGTTASYSILSFNGNKIITTTGGGMVLAKSPDAVVTMKKWANQSRELAVEYLHRELGYNYRMSNVLAGIGRGQMQVLDDRVAARQRVFSRYVEAFADIPSVVPQPIAPWGTHSRWLSVFYVDPRDVTPSTLVRALEQDSIEARPVWRPMHTQPLFADARAIGGGVAESLYQTGICLPSSSSLTEQDQVRVIEAFRTCFSSAGSRSR